MLGADTAAPSGLYSAQRQELDSVIGLAVGIRDIIHLGIQRVHGISGACPCPFLDELSHLGNRNNRVQNLLRKTERQT